MRSINQNIETGAEPSGGSSVDAAPGGDTAPSGGVNILPSFRNFGSLLRIVLIVNGACLALALSQAESVAAWGSLALQMLTVMQPALITSLLVLAAADVWLQRMSYAPALAIAFSVVLAVTSIVYWLEQDAWSDTGPLWRYWAYAGIATAILAAYFNLRNRALSPAVAEARLQALQARIRPHFLFNSINAVLGVIRQNPTQAEHALEDMAELFRASMADQRQMTTLAAEVALCQQYLALEQLRLGERLVVQWEIAQMPADARIPLLILQPLVENAVYYGVEPRSAPSVIGVSIKRDGEYVRIVLRNPYQATGADARQHAGNHMALANIRERLRLHFDVEAALHAGIEGDAYEVRITLPYLREQP